MQSVIPEALGPALSPRDSLSRQRFHDDSMRILHIIARLNDGGPTRVLREWCRGLEEHGHQVHILCGRCDANEPDMSQLLRAEGIGMTILPELGRGLHPLRDLIALQRLCRAIRRLQPDLIHTHTAKAGFLGRLAARLCRRPCLHSYHGHVLSGYWSRPINACFIALERLAARWGHCHSLSPGLVAELRDGCGIGRRQRWHYLPIPIRALTPDPDPPRARAEAWDLQGWDPLVPTIGILGRLVPVKQPLLALEAVALAAQQRPLQCLIMGDGPLRPQVEAAIAAGGLRAWCTGFVPAAAGLGLCQLLLLSSRNEGTPLSVIEAASLGLPVVATAVGGLRDLQPGPHLHLVPVTAKDLAAAIVSVLAQREDATLAAQITSGGRKLAESFAPAALIPGYIHLYRSLIAEHQRANPPCPDSRPC